MIDLLKELNDALIHLGNHPGERRYRVAELRSGIPADGILELVSQVDVIVLAQASMARVVNTLPADKVIVPVLSSPRLAIEHLARELV